MKRILVPVDFSTAMEGVLALASELATALEAELHLLHVREIAPVPVFPAATVGYPGVGMSELGMAGGIPLPTPDLVGEGAPNEKQKSPLNAIAAEATAKGLRASVHEREGAVVEEILQTADRFPAESDCHGLARPRLGLQPACRERD